MFDNIYYYFLNIFEQNGIILLIGLILIIIAFSLKDEEYSNFKILLHILGGCLLLWGGILKIIALLFSLGIGILFGFLGNEMTKSEK